MSWLGYVEKTHKKKLNPTQGVHIGSGPSYGETWPE